MSVPVLARRRALTAKLWLPFAATAVLCLAQFPPPSDSGQYAAKVLTMTGQVSVLRDLVQIPLNEGDTVQVQQMIVTGADGHATFEVSDGSTFEVFPNSHLVFRKNAWNPRDMIDLLVGRIRVHIEHLLGTPNPNHVITPTAVISVRGTIFDVTVGDDDETTEVEVEEGVVEVRHALLPSVTKTLKAGESIKVYKSEPLEARVWDRGQFFHYLLRGIDDAANMAVMRTGRGVLGTSGGGSGGTPDTGKSSGGAVGGSGTATAGAPPTPPPPPPAPPGFIDPGVSDPGATAPETRHHDFLKTIRTAAIRTVEYLGRMVGFTPPSMIPIEF